LDTLTNPTPTDPLNSPSVPHAAQHANANDAIEALQAKVGITNSTDVNSLDYKSRALTNPTITGGTINNTVIGGTTPAAGTFTNLTAADGTDATKKAVFATSGISTATTRTITLPDSNTTIPIATQVLTFSGPTAARTYTLPNANSTLAATSDKLNAFAATSSAELAGVISDETGTGALVFANSPTLTGTPEAPTAAAGTNTTQLATTAFVQAEISLAISGSLSAIGTPGQHGFGVGICPSLPSGFSPIFGTTDPSHDNYGNYLYSDGSIMVWVPAFYYRIGHTNNPTYAAHTVNSVDILPYSAFADVAAANTAGYALHRAFYDAGAIQLGFFVDKYQASNNGGIASSIKNGNPLSTNSAHNPIGSLIGLTSGDNNYGGCFKAAKTRGPQFFPATRYQYAALALLALAHGQAANSSARCAWYDAAGVINYPKGCNNNALRDTNDTSVLYVSDGYSNCGKTGSATPFAKTTHNGQGSGVADLNGNMWEVSTGITCVAGTKTITAATKANPVAITATAHGLSTGAVVQISSVGGMTQINDKLFTVTVVDSNTLTLNDTDGTAFGTYTSGGTLTFGTFYALNTSYAAKNLTGGNTLSTDQFGATGVAAHSTAIAPAFRTDYPQNGFEKRYGRGSNAVLDAATTGAGWLLTGLAAPVSSGISDGTTGSNLFGSDRLYQFIRNELCLISGADWTNGSSAGAWAAGWAHARPNSSDYVGFRAASYL
jgi:hypothetical protein